MAARRVSTLDKWFSKGSTSASAVQASGTAPSAVAIQAAKMTPKQVLASEFASKQKRRVVMDPDGNCFHRAWAMRLWGNADLHQRARNLEEDFLRAHPDLFLKAIQKVYPGGRFPTSAAYADHICTPRVWASDFDARIMLAATGLARATNHIVDERSGTILNSYVVAEGDDPAGRTIDLIALPRHYDLAVAQNIP